MSLSWSQKRLQPENLRYDRAVARSQIPSSITRLPDSSISHLTYVQEGNQTVEHRQVEEARLLFRERESRRQPHDEGSARRKGLGPRRDDQCGPARAARVHDHYRGLQHLLQG